MGQRYKKNSKLRYFTQKTLSRLRYFTYFACSDCDILHEITFVFSNNLAEISKKFGKKMWEASQLSHIQL